jgi:intracellular sulfur oxidation DsrE/DsrF family protein
MRGVLFVLALLVSAASLAADMHRIVFQVNDNEPARMNLVLNNVANLEKYYQDKGEEAQIEVVAYGPGLMMLHGAKSPVKDRVISFGQNFDNVKFLACGNTMAKMKKKTGKDVPLVGGVEVLPEGGVVHLTAREEEGWTYLKP